ncbi:hypothetical protein NMY22_g15498 [Coprinellus aureogranulatus]|nr:hypothetical protein NMY22_g15498 [Coprinellus aureogranulatus]
MALNRFFCVLALSLAWSVSASCVKLDPRQNTTVLPNQYGCNLWEWSAPYVKTSSGAYRTEAAQNPNYFTKYYNSAQHWIGYNNGYNMDADHLFEAQMAASPDPFDNSRSYNFMYWHDFDVYRTRLNNRQNMIFINPDINLEKATCITSIIYNNNPQCSNLAKSYLLWNSKDFNVRKVMWATALELDQILYDATSKVSRPPSAISPVGLK